MQQSASTWMMGWSVHQFCKKGCSPHQPWADNIDHNPTAMTATTSFHGASISVFQHPTKEDRGKEHRQLKFGEEKVKTVPELPDSFINVQPAFFTKKKPSPPTVVWHTQTPVCWGHNWQWSMSGRRSLLWQMGQWVPVRDLCCTLAEKSKGMPFFHAFTGCEVISAFHGKKKKSAWQTWDVCDKASGVFSKLSQYPPVVDDDDLETLEKFVVMMYDRSSTAEGVDDARLGMFAWKQSLYEAIPPTRSVLK